MANDDVVKAKDVTMFENAFRYTIEVPVEIIVGEGDGAETHYVHPSLLCEKSGYLRGRLQNESSEITTRRIRLVDVKPITFRYLLKWLYTGDIAPSPELEDDCSHVPSVRLLLIDIYVLAHRMLCPKLEDRSMDVIQHCCKNVRLNLEDLVHVVNSKVRASQMWRYFIKQLSFDASQTGWSNYTGLDGWPDFVASAPGFVSELLLETESQAEDESVAKEDRENPALGRGCEWHVHGKGSGCKGVRWPRRAFRP